MRALGNYIIRGRLEAIAVISFFTLITVLLPPLAYLLSGVPVGLVTLRRGARIGMQVITGSLLFTFALSLGVGLNYFIPIAFALGIWLPVYICSVALRQGESQGILVMVAGGFGVLFVLLMHLMVGDVSVWWKEWLDAWFIANMPDETSVKYQEIFESAIPLMNAMMSASFVVSLVLTTLLARWWQSRLFNPGGFRTEFYKLSLPRWLAIPTLVMVILLVSGNQEVMSVVRDCLFVVVFMYLFQGISAVHRTVRAREMSHTWLVFMYGFLLIIPQMVLFLACIGMADVWMNRDKYMGGNDES